jgi:hypothetical protein
MEPEDMVVMEALVVLEVQGQLEETEVKAVQVGLVGHRMVMMASFTTQIPESRFHNRFTFRPERVIRQNNLIIWEMTLKEVSNKEDQSRVVHKDVEVDPTEEFHNKSNNNHKILITLKSLEQFRLLSQSFFTLIVGPMHILALQSSHIVHLPKQPLPTALDARISNI